MMDLCNIFFFPFFVMGGRAIRRSMRGFSWDFHGFDDDDDLWMLVEV